MNVVEVLSPGKFGDSFVVSEVITVALLWRYIVALLVVGGDVFFGSLCVECLTGFQQVPVKHVVTEIDALSSRCRLNKSMEQFVVRFSLEAQLFAVLDVI